MENLNLELYSEKLLKEWTSIRPLFSEEKFLLEKYLTLKENSVLEVGTGGGRISFHIEKMGFENITAFDIVPEMIQIAKENAIKNGSTIDFQVGDATLMNFEDSSFDTLVYLQQVLCFVPTSNMFKLALKESHRVAKKGGIVIFSFLDFQSRWYNQLLFKVLTLLGKLRNESLDSKYIELPWLKYSGKINWFFLAKNQAKTIWVNKNEIKEELENIGFEIVELVSSNDIPNASKGGIYVVCRK